MASPRDPHHRASPALAALLFLHRNPNTAAKGFQAWEGDRGAARTCPQQLSAKTWGQPPPPCGHEDAATQRDPAQGAGGDETPSRGSPICRAPSPSPSQIAGRWKRQEEGGTLTSPTWHPGRAEGPRGFGTTPVPSGRHWGCRQHPRVPMGHASLPLHEAGSQPTPPSPNPPGAPHYCLRPQQDPSRSPGVLRRRQPPAARLQRYPHAGSGGVSSLPWAQRIRQQPPSPPWGARHGGGQGSLPAQSHGGVTGGRHRTQPRRSQPHAGPPKARKQRAARITKAAISKGSPKRP